MNSVNPPQENQIKINGLNINYKTIGNGDVPIVLLHGWGINSDKYLELARYLSELRITNYELRILIPDLPGFGKSDEPKENWNLDDYAEFVDKFVETLAVGGLTSNKETRAPNKFILIGHSFGGRIAIKYAAKYPEKIEKLILTGAAGIKHKLNAKQEVFFVLAKTGKKIFSTLKEAKLPSRSLASMGRKFLYKAAREKDYYQASARMKKIMKNVIAEDLSLILGQVKIPTLLVWGKDDHSTPLSDGKIMNEKIKDSKLIVIKRANHSLPYQNPEKFARVMWEFIKK